ncbi:MAG: hypothetical protein ACT443_03180 [Gemmatimonadota bacterium]
MGEDFGLVGAARASVWFSERWGMLLDVRGRQVGRGDRMGELLKLIQ